MATTRLITIHISKGKGAGGSFAGRLDYACNPDKTEDGQLVTGFACDPKTAANEFELMRRTYLNITGVSASAIIQARRSHPRGSKPDRI